MEIARPIADNQEANLRKGLEVEQARLNMTVAQASPPWVTAYVPAAGQGLYAPNARGLLRTLEVGPYPTASASSGSALIDTGRTKSRFVERLNSFNQPGQEDTL